MDASGDAGGPWLMRIEKPGIGAVRVGPGLDWSGFGALWVFVAFLVGCHWLFFLCPLHHPVNLKNPVILSRYHIHPVVKAMR